MRLGADDRGQAIQVGAIILFGFVVIAFAGYQAVSVPDQNQEVEFKHSMQMADQMQEFRADVIEAASTGATRSQAFKLGTDYPARLFAVNPPPASGQLSTTTYGGGEYVLDAPGADLEDICGLTDGTGNSVDSKALVYEPNYNEYTQAPTIVYENTVTYREFPGDVRLDSGQNLIDGKTLTLTPLVGNVSESTSATRTVDLAPGKAGIGATNATTVNITVPTALDAGTWEDLLESELVENGGQVADVSENTTTGGVDIALESAEYTVICPPVGLGSAPDNEPADVLSRSGEGGSDLNPGGPGEVRLTGIQRAQLDKDVIVVTYTNGGEAVNLTSIRFNFYNDPNGDGPEKVDVFNYTDYDNDDPALVEDLILRGASDSPSATQTFAGSAGTTQVALEFEVGSDVFNTAESDFAVIRMSFSDGQESLYFIDMPKNSDTVGGGTATPTSTATPAPGTMAARTTLTSSSTETGNDEIQFTLSNGGSDAVTIERVSLSNPPSGVSQIQRSGDELTQGGDGRYDGTMNIDGSEYTLSPAATIAGNADSSFNLGEFDGNMNNNDVTLTLYFSDGSQQSYTLSG